MPLENVDEFRVNTKESDGWIGSLNAIDEKSKTWYRA